MFCDGCGTAMQSGQAFCSGFGKQILGNVPPQPLPGRVQRHVHLLAILWLAFSAFNTLGGLVLGILILAKAAFGFLAGWGLLQREPWARTIAIVLAFISLFTNIPVGTAMGVYTMWVLLPAASEQEYGSLVAARPA